ncbi:SWIM zinc finger family protein [Streptomyces sp. B4I13]|uniref:SWIM zinc finger family protein n=1 Tax=Streptomyces sp. B4I13 TaxID=3042271 RepID=UPI0027D8B78A|nr:SWIM zinc finger family protein [Streptomyces sp. B4I13]
MEAVTPTGPRPAAPAAPPAPAGPAAVDAAGTGAAASDEQPVPSSPHLTTVPSTTPPWTESAPDATTAPPATTGPRPGDVAREALRAARAQARRGPSGTGVRSSADAPAEAAGQPAHEAHERAARRRRHRPGPDPGAGSFALPAGRSADVRRADHTRDRVAEERARAVRELLAGSFRMPTDDTAEPGSVPEPEPVPEPGCKPVPAPATTSATTRASEPVRGTRRDHAEDGPEAPEAPEAPHAPEGPYAPDGREDHAFSLVLDDVPPHTPRSMAAPSRDGDHRRTFPAFPPRTGGDFAGTWWGNAWVAALEEGALDQKRVLRGRGYAEQGNVDAITVTPGHVLAYVQGSRARPYRVQVRLRTFGEEDWERFLAAAVEHPGHIAALLDKEMPESLAECGVPLLPGPGDLEPHCSCPDRGHPCKHAAALCYQTARLLDADPFVLLLLRGRGERELLDALSRRNAARAARAAQERQPRPLPGVRAAEVLAERRLPPLPAPLPAPAHPEQPPVYPSAPSGPDSFALDHLATDAAARAHALLTTGHDGIGALTLWQDAVRLAASRPGSGLTAATRALYASLASAAGRTPSELARAVAAWRQGGPDGLAVLEESWDPPAGRFDRARPLLLAADLPAFRPRRNHLTHPRGHVQLRFGRDGLWYAYESEPGHDDWWPRGTPDPDPVGALTGLGGSGEF